MQMPYPSLSPALVRSATSGAEGPAAADVRTERNTTALAPPTNAADTPSSTASATTVSPSPSHQEEQVLSSVVRRYRAEKRRLERWRLGSGGGGEAGPLNARADLDVDGQRGTALPGAAPSPELQAAHFHRGSTVGERRKRASASPSAPDRVVVRRIQAWWRSLRSSALASSSSSASRRAGRPHRFLPSFCQRLLSSRTSPWLSAMRAAAPTSRWSRAIAPLPSFYSFDGSDSDGRSDDDDEEEEEASLRSILGSDGGAKMPRERQDFSRGSSQQNTISECLNTEAELRPFKPEVESAGTGAAQLQSCAMASLLTIEAPDTLSWIRGLRRGDANAAVVTDTMSLLLGSNSNCTHRSDSSEVRSRGSGSFQLFTRSSGRFAAWLRRCRRTLRRQTRRRAAALRDFRSEQRRHHGPEHGWPVSDTTTTSAAAAAVVVVSGDPWELETSGVSPQYGEMTPDRNGSPFSSTGVVELTSFTEAQPRKGNDLRPYDAAACRRSLFQKAAATAAYWATAGQQQQQIKATKTPECSAPTTTKPDSIWSAAPQMTELDPAARLATSLSAMSRFTTSLPSSEGHRRTRGGSATTVAGPKAVDLLRRFEGACGSSAAPGCEGADTMETGTTRSTTTTTSDDTGASAPGGSVVGASPTGEQGGRGDRVPSGSLLSHSAYASKDVAARETYESLVQEVCVDLVQQRTKVAKMEYDGAASRALSEWVLRQVVEEVLSAKTPPDSLPSLRSPSAASPRFVGVLRHIRNGTPVSLSALDFDDEDNSIFYRVQQQRHNSAVATTLPTPGYSVTFEQLASLCPGEWLNDQVINNYLELLCLHQDGTIKASPSTGQHDSPPCRRVASMGTHFFAKIESELQRLGHDRDDDAGSFPSLPPTSPLLRWLRRRQHLLQPFDAAAPHSTAAVLVPVNITGQHWALAVLFKDAAFYSRPSLSSAAVARRSPQAETWVLFDSLCRSTRARTRGRRILAALAHAWEACRIHFQTNGSGPLHQSTATRDRHLRCLSPVLQVAAPFTPQAGAAGAAPRRQSAVDTCFPFSSVAAMQLAERRLQNQMEALPPPLPASCNDAAGSGATASFAGVTLSDEETEWFTGGFEHMPQQSNGDDCGVFVCHAAWCIAHGVSVTFLPSDISTTMRRIITYELWQSKLLRRYPGVVSSSSCDVRMGG